MLSQTLGLAVLVLPLLAEAKDCSQAAFQKIIPSNSTFNYVTKVAAGGTFTDAYANANATGLPEGCAVSVRVPTPGTSSYNMAIYLPNKWNSRIMTTGNGGYAGFTNWQDLGIYSQYGFAALTTVSKCKVSNLWYIIDDETGHRSRQCEPAGLDLCSQQRITRKLGMASHARFGPRRQSAVCRILRREPQVLLILGMLNWRPTGIERDAGIS